MATDGAAGLYCWPKTKIHYHQCTGGGLRKGGYVQPDHGSGPPLPGQAFSATSVVEMTVSELERSICLDWARVGAGQGNSVEDKRVRLESEDFDARWLRRGMLADRGDGTLRVHVPRSLPAGS